MKKLNDANMGIFVLLSVCLCLFSCNNDNDNLPKDYAGFEHSKETVECESDKSECELKIKIVATEKTKEDRGSTCHTSSGNRTSSSGTANRKESNHQSG